MAVRAVILAAENYPKSVGLASKLEGTSNNARAFQDWLVQKKGLNPVSITFLPDPIKAAIARAFRDLVDTGKDNTEELYVFFSCHGFSFNDTPFKQKPADVIVGTEFESLENSGDACLRLSDIQLALWRCLGPGTHYFFIDACRNPVPAGKVAPGTLGWSREDSNIGQPRQFTLFSAERGSMAAVQSGFAPALVDGLSGRGKAKLRDGFQMFVTFDSLCRYLEESVLQKIQSDPGGGTGRILQIDPIPNYHCDVQVEGAAQGDVFTLVVHNALRQLIVGPQQFQGDHTDFTQGPDDYYVLVTHTQFALTPPDAVKTELYDDCAVKFQKTPGPVTRGELPPPTAPLPPASVELRAPTSAQLLIRNVSEISPKEVVSGTFSRELDPGEYEVRVTEPGWSSIRKHRFQVKPGDTLSLDAALRTSSPVKDALIRAIPGQHDADRVDFSESLGPMANQDLGLWLSLIGASRIVRDWDAFSKLKALPLDTFDDARPGDAPTYMLLGFESLPPSLKVAVHEFGDPPRWQVLTPVPPLDGVFQHRANSLPGLHLVSLRLPGKAPFTTAIYTVASRATLFVVADDESSGMRIHQYVLPLAKLQQFLTPQEQALLPQNPLKAIRFMTLAQRQMARRRSMNPAEGTADPEDLQAWVDLLYGKWLDPVMAIMASYELVRNGAFPIGEWETGWVVLRNLREYFSQFSDVEIIAKLAKDPNAQPPARLPLFLTGLVALDNYEHLLPLPAAHLDTAGPWVTWLSAVE